MCPLAPQLVNLWCACVNDKVRAGAGTNKTHLSSAAIADEDQLEGRSCGLGSHDVWRADYVRRSEGGHVWTEQPTLVRARLEGFYTRQQKGNKNENWKNRESDGELTFAGMRKRGDGWSGSDAVD